MKVIRGPKPPFQSLFDEQSERVVRFLRTMLPPAEAEDAAQETFVAALRAYPSFDGANPRAWLLTIARNKGLDELRRRGRVAEEALDAESLAADAIEPEEWGGLWLSVAELPAKQRAAMVLRFALDLRFREIGIALNCSEAAARRNVHEGLRKLRAVVAAGAGTEHRE